MVDALDESLPLTNILNIALIMTNSQYRKTQLFATSREYAEIRRTMSAIAEPLSFTNPLIESDIGSPGVPPQALLDVLYRVQEREQKDDYYLDLCKIDLLFFF